MAATKRNVDLTDVKEGGGGNFRPRRKPEGDYLAKIVRVEDHKPKSADSVDGWVYTVQIDGDSRSSYAWYVNPAPKQKWKIAKTAAACGLNIAGKRVSFDPNKLVGKAVGVFLEDDEYDGRPKSTIADIFTTAEVGSAGGDGDVADDEYEDAEDIDTDVPDDDVVEDEPEPEPEPAPAPRKRTAKKAAPAPVVEDDEDYEDEEPEPAPAPKKRARPAAKPAPAPVADDEDDDLDLDDLDD